MRQDFSPSVAALITDHLPALGPGTPDGSLREQLSRLKLNTAFAGQPIADEDAARCCLAALWLHHDFLDESHEISQEIGTPEGSYWHAIMHRREPDYWNAKYWFRRVGRHAIHDPLAAEARQMASRHDLDAPAEFLATQSSWDSFRFVDLCEAIARGRSQSEQLSRQIARIEWQFLFDHCFQKAVGAS